MFIDTHTKKCLRFLRDNGWKYDPKGSGGSGAFIKDYFVAVELQKDEIIFLDDTGDFMHLPMNYYALVGALLEMRQITANYKSTRVL